MIKLLKIFGVVVALLMVIAVVKNIANKKTTKETSMAEQTVLESGDYVRDLIKWPDRPWKI